MKVDVLQVKEATFLNRFCWWSKWVDVAVFDYGNCSYLIQMKVSRDNSKKFKTVNTAGIFGSFLGGAETSQVGNLTQMQGGNDD